MLDRLSVPSRISLAARCALAGFFFCFSCAPEGSGLLFPSGDLRPPAVLQAGQSAQGSFDIVFDEEVRPLSAEYAISLDGLSAIPVAEGKRISVSISPPVGPGVPCELAGEAADISGNTTRFMFSFVGYNGNPVRFIINELQTGKNSSVTTPHRDYVELLATHAGNAGGVVVQYASSVKIMEYVFPSVEIGAGELVVLHCAPEGSGLEKDETGADRSASGGIDSSPYARDFWCQAGGIPDESGIVLVKDREGDPPADACFYAAGDKAGSLAGTKLEALAVEIVGAGLWECSDPPGWGDAFHWNPSSSRPLHRIRSMPTGASSWTVGESGSQSPGLPEPSAVSRRLKTSRSVSAGKP